MENGITHKITCGSANLYSHLQNKCNNPSSRVLKYLKYVLVILNLDYPKEVILNSKKTYLSICAFYFIFNSRKCGGKPKYSKIKI